MPLTKKPNTDICRLHNLRLISYKILNFIILNNYNLFCSCVILNDLEDVSEEQKQKMFWCYKCVKEQNM